MISEKLLDETFDVLLEIDAVVDVPFVPIEKPITTNIQAPPTRDDRPIAIRVIPKKKWDEEDDELEEAPVPPPPYPGGKPGGVAENSFLEQAPDLDRPEEPVAPGTAPGMGAGMGMGMDMMGIAQPQLSDPGKGLELKKIFSRLLALQNFLSSSADQGLIVLRDYVSKAVELFRTVIDNLSSYKEKIDDIIVLFYDFIEKSYAVMKEYYRIKTERSNNQNG